MKWHSILIKVLMWQYLLIATVTFASENNDQKPAVLLANLYSPDINLHNYWVSEKLDGVRAYWDGTHLVSRQGNSFNAPEWFTAPLPKTVLDGELWLGRGQFERLSGVVRRQSPDDDDWRDVKYMVFDLPNNIGNFDQRLNQLKEIVKAINAPHLQMVEQVKVSSHEVLQNKLDDVVRLGGEGLMLHSGLSLYKSGRSNNLLKLKKYLDAEAVVVNHIPGTGKYKGMLGSLEVETADKRRFKVGSGFTDAERKTPPIIGSVITYKYFGLTNKGIPRFASFMRVRNAD